MKQKLFFAAVLTSLLMAGCVKEGDLNALRHPISIQGEFDPTIGVPLAHMEAHMSDFVGLWNTSTNMTTEIDAATGIVAFRYSDTMHTEMDYTNAGKGRGWFTKGEGDTLILDRRPLNGHTDIRLFKELTAIDTGELEAKGMYISIVADMRTTVSDPILALSDYGVELYFDSMILTIEFQDGTSEDIDIDSMHNVNIRELAQGRRVPIFRNYDASSLVNRKPVGLSYRTNLNVAKIGTAMIPISAFLYIRDSLHVDKISSTLITNMDFPMQLYCNHMSFTDTVSLDLSQMDSLLNIYEISMRDTGSSLIFEVENGLPLVLTLDAFCLDAQMNVISPNIFTPGQNLINSAPITDPHISGINSYVSNGKETTRLIVPFNNELVKQLRRTRFLRMIIGINSASRGADPSDPKPTISVRGTDELNLRLHSNLAPHVSYPFHN